ncbi:MAG TPA: hypothetical protein VHA05_00925 [Candidatus Saccharimonadales bacterium]|nr:hypothetical protein [Candidatus Saccharimonadales bacterium]
MAVTEVGFRSAGEYVCDQRPRLSEEQLCVDGLYVGMFSLAGESGCEAAKQVCRITDIELWGKVYGVALEILDEDFQVESSGWAIFENGSLKLARDLSVGGEAVETCYFKKPYFGWSDKVMEHCMALHSEAGEEPFI